MLPGQPKPATRSQKANPSPSYAEAFAAGGVAKKLGFPRLGGQPSTGGVLKSNMGNILAGQAAAPAPANANAAAKASVGGFRSRIGLGGVIAKNKLGFRGAQSSAAPLQPRGNPTGGAGGALPGVGVAKPRGFGQALGGGLGGQQKPASSAAQKVLPRPAQRFKIRKDSALFNAKTDTGTLVPRRPFAGKEVELGGPSTSRQGPLAAKGDLLVSVDVPDRAVGQKGHTPKARLAAEPECCETLDDGVASLISKTDKITIRDIDRADNSPQLVPEYVNEISSYLFAVEAEKFRVKERFLDRTNLTGRMRAILLDWLVQVHQNFGFKQETLFIATSILDRFLIADGSIERVQLQLVGATALLIATKYEEIYVPRVQDFANISDRAYNARDIQWMEVRILTTIAFDLSLPTPSFFLRRCSKAALADITIHSTAKYVIELAMIDYSSCHIRPSLVAAAALALALMITRRKALADVWDATVAHYSRYGVAQLVPSVEILANVLVAAYEADGKLLGVRRKYSAVDLQAVSRQPSLRPENWKAWFAEELKATKALVA